MSRINRPDAIAFPLFAWVTASIVACSIVLPFHARAQVDPNLVAYWRLNGSGAELVTGNNLTGTGNVSFVGGQPQLGLAADINGAATSYLLAPAQSAYDVTSGGFTVEFWVQPGSLPGTNPRMIRAVNSDQSQGWESYICKGSCAQGRVAFTINSGVPQLLSTSAIDDGSWHHIAATYDGSDMTLYIDGAVEATSSQPGLQSTVAGGTLVLGANVGSPDQYDGLIDEVRIWSVARTATQIQNAMNNELLPYPTSADGEESPRAPLFLSQNRPNPFNPNTIIEYYVPGGSRVQLHVHDLGGRLIARLVDGFQSGGPHWVSWSGQDSRGRLVASGVYSYRLVVAGFAHSRRMVLIK